MIRESNLEVVPGFDAYQLKDLIEARPGWKAELVKASNVELVATDKGAALECIDGRFDQLDNRKMHGPRVAGGTNLIAALLTGADYLGYARAAKIIERSGYRPGTHGDDGRNPETGEPLPGCVAHYLFMTGQMEAARYPWRMDRIDYERLGLKPVEVVRAVQEKFGGKHFRLNGQHMEEGIRFNPFVDTTERSRSGDRFRADFWYPAQLRHHVGPREVRTISLDAEVAFKCEVIEKAKRDAMKAEILIP